MEKKIIVKITPAAVLMAVLVLVAAILLTRGDRRDKQPLTIDDTPVIVTKIRSLGQLTTACYYDEMVLTRSKQNSFSASPSAPWPGTASGRTWTTTWSSSPRERSVPAWTSWT